MNMFFKVCLGLSTIITSKVKLTPAPLLPPSSTLLQRNAKQGGIKKMRKLHPASRTLPGCWEVSVNIYCRTSVKCVMVWMFTGKFVCLCVRVCVQL